jgi:hypothetical protein
MGTKPLYDFATLSIRLETIINPSPTLRDACEAGCRACVSSKPEQFACYGLPSCPRVNFTNEEN